VVQVKGRTVLGYVLAIGASMLVIVLLLQVGERAFGVSSAAAPANDLRHGGAGMPILLTLIVQISLILALCRLLGWALKRVHQPQVVSEMIAGLLLGPSLLGAIAPGLHQTLFPPESLGFLSTLSQIGALLFMFLVGLQFDPKLLRGHGETAVVTSHVSIAFPFLLGVLLAFFLYEPLAPAGVGFTGFALFLGAAMSVTAFPVLARILAERDLLQTRLGSLALSCAAIDDVTAWIVLAVVVVLVRSTESAVPLWLTIGGVIVYAGVAIGLLRPWLARLHSRFRTPSWLTQDGLGMILLLALASAWITERLGVHSLFGAFLAGAILPKEKALVGELSRRFEDLTVVFLLPLFFAFTGLRTSFSALLTPEGWLWGLLIIAVAVVGKFGGATASARLTGMSWREAGAIGVLMNTRGLISLVILNIGLDIGVISPALFSMMVVMALVTTAMTTPLLGLLVPVWHPAVEIPISKAAPSRKAVLAR
jgi:Kef-type K+ transport system membrane component KefB